MSGLAMALEELNVPVTKYYSSEIDKYANKAAQALYPDTIQLGDVTQWREWNIDWASIDLVTGGFPCQAWSMAGKQLGDKDERGMLFWTMLDIMKHVKYHNPKAHFLIENVKMKKEFEQYITTHTENALGHVHKILINSALVSAQNRNRYYWASFKVEQPEDKGILLKDILEGEHDTVKCGAMRGRYIVDEKRADHLVSSQKGITKQRLELRKDDKTNTLTTVQKDNYVVRGKSKTVRSGGRGSYDRHEWDSISNCHYRKLTPRECMRLQTVPERHIDTLLNAGISNTQLYKMTGNSWTVDVIAHILKAM